jgi:CRP/FNR family cyclic AMP-dependent transcriptional regulator
VTGRAAVVVSVVLLTRQPALTPARGSEDGKARPVDVMAMISEVDLFRSLNESHRSYLANCTGTSQYQAGDVIIRQGEEGSHLSIIVSGRVEVRRERPSREPVVLNELGPGQFFGEMALLDDRPRTATVIALEDTLCLSLFKWHFRVQLESHPEMAIAILPEIARRWRETLDRLAVVA